MGVTGGACVCSVVVVVRVGGREGGGGSEVINQMASSWSVAIATSTL